MSARRTREDVIGTTVAGRYAVAAFQRAGRFGDVYRATRTGDDAPVFIKLLNRGSFGDHEASERFAREVRVLSGFRHGGTPQVLDHGLFGKGEIYLVTAAMEGRLLSEIIAAGPMPIPAVRSIAAQVADVLAAAHQQGIVHRDVMPGNILVGTEDRTWLLDFGLSHLTDPSDGLTTIGVRVGTPVYMAPEYIDRYILDHRSDLYALGVTIFEMLTGAPPFVGRPMHVLGQHVGAAVPALSSRIDGVPPWLETLVLALLEKNPDARPQRSIDVAHQLRNGPTP